MLAGLLAPLSFMYFVGATTIIQANVCAPLDTPVITAPQGNVSVDYDEPVVVTGTATSGSTVTLIQDTTPYASTVADESDTFSMQALFQSGTHSISVRSSNACETKSSNSFGVTVSAAPVVTPTQPETPQVSTPDSGSPVSQPSSSNVSSDNQSTGTSSGSDTSLGSGSKLVLSITSPEAGSTLDQSVYVTGRVNKNALITIEVNGKTVGLLLFPGLSYGFSVPLGIGDNTIEVTAQTNDGETSVQSIRVTRYTSNESSTSGTQVKWYKTTPGKVVIIGSSTIILIIIVILFIL